MPRVASLYLPQWPIERLRQVERRHAPPESAPASLKPLAEAAAKEQQNACSVPRGGGWRPGARWAREEQAAQIAALPAHQRPSIRELGRCDVAAPPPFRAMPPDEGTRAGEWRPPAPRPPASDTPSLITSIRDGSRIVIAAACPQAQSLGLRPGMAITQARAQVAGLDIRPADPQGDGAALMRLAVRAARRWCPIVAIDGADGLLLDLTGTAHLFGGEGRMARRLIRFLARAGYSARIAIADTPGAAHALARHSAGGLCPPGAQAKALAPLPVTALRVEERAVELLKRLGVETIGALAAMPRAPLVRRFGGHLVMRLDQALGHLPEPFDPVIPAEPICVTQRFAEPIASPEAIEHWLGTLVPRLTQALAAAGIGARRIELIADRIDGVPQVIRLGLARPTHDPAHILRLLLRRIEEVEPGYGIDVLALHLRRAEPLGYEPIGERLDEAAPPNMAVLVDTLATRIGSRAIWRQRPMESDVPERSVAPMPVLDPPARAAQRLAQDNVRQLDCSAGVAPWDPAWPRPVRLLRRPERIDHVVAEMPDHAPRRFTWRGQSHRVVRSDGPERITGEWWRHQAERDSVRDYFRVEDEEGRRFWLFRRGDGERAITGDLSWYLHGCFA